MLRLPVYLDYNATSPCDPRVVDEMLPYFVQNFGNASSRHHLYGWQAEEAVEQARERVALLIGCEPREIVFTSGATEATNLALKGVYQSYHSKGNHIICTGIEHKAVLDTCTQLQKAGAEVSFASVRPDGLVDPEEIRSLIKPHTVLIACMYANNELGTIMPVKEIGTLAKAQGVIFFSDATQAVGKIRVNVLGDRIDLLALSGHKIYGPKGVGALYVRRRNPRVRLSPQIEGGGQERGIRSGTLNVPGIVGLGKAADLCYRELGAVTEKIGRLRDRLEGSLLSLGGVKINGNKDLRLPHVSNLSFEGVESEAMMMSFNKDIAVSSGSACTSATIEPSYVLKALGLSDEEAYSSLRFSLGRFTTEEEIDFVTNRVSQTVRELRALARVG